jgi:hypothetical protein
MGFSLEKGLIKYHGKVWIAHNSALQTMLINAFHASAIGGHSGIKATYHRLKQLFHWKQLFHSGVTFLWSRLRGRIFMW